jgi:hypothetical protein
LDPFWVTQGTWGRVIELDKNFEKIKLECKKRKKVHELNKKFQDV